MRRAAIWFVLLLALTALSLAQEHGEAQEETARTREAAEPDMTRLEVGQLRDSGGGAGFSHGEERRAILRVPLD